MGEYEYIADPGKEQRPPCATGSEARAPFRPPKLVSSTCFTDYEVRRGPASLSEPYVVEPSIPWSDACCPATRRFPERTRIGTLLSVQSRDLLNPGPLIRY